MVLHNNKWDRKAKVRYLKKHGIPPPPPKGPQPKWNPNQESESDSSHDLDGSEGSDTGEIVAENAAEDTTESQQAETTDVVHQGSLVEFEFPDNTDNDDFVAKHIASFKYEKPKPKNVVYTESQQQFDEINELVARGKLTQDIKRRFGKSTYKLNDKDEGNDDEESDFWTATAPTSKPQRMQKAAANNKIEVDATKQTFLDNLLD